MSGIVGILNLDGAPVDRSLVAAMTRALAFRGPDAQETWADGPVGLGHSLLRTTWESATERQPLTLDGKIWITADCRVDARAELVQALTDCDSVAANGAPDPELILRAYTVWGEPCVERLLGDFAFAIWDAPRRTLFCARDHFGVKPFFYAKTARVLVVTNDLNCARVHPAVTNDLDEGAIADFLVHGYALDTDRSSFRAIRRLPPAHTLRVRDGQTVLARYWQIPLEEELRYRRRGDYVEHFHELLDTAVRDRLRTNTVSVLMSGGLDSPTITASAHRVLKASGRPFDLRAHTVVFDRIVPDEERKYSQLAADRIGVPIHHYPFDDYGFPPDESEPDWYPPEPRFLFDRCRAMAVNRGPARAARVLFRGDGADPLIDGDAAVDRCFKAGRHAFLLKEFLWLAWARGQAPRIGLRSLVRRRLAGRQAPAPPMAPFPNWLAPGLEQRLGLRDRWRASYAEEYVRPGFELAHSYWPLFFESVDPGAMRLAAEFRYPFLDLRLARYLLRLPPVPWAAQKSILRIAMKSALPAAILRRPKAPLAGNPWASLVPPAASRWWEAYLSSTRELEAFVNVSAAKAAVADVLTETQAMNAHGDIDRLRLHLRPLSLNLWLQQTTCANFRFAATLTDEVTR